MKVKKHLKTLTDAQLVAIASQKGVLTVSSAEGLDRDILIGVLVHVKGILRPAPAV